MGTFEVYLNELIEEKIWNIPMENTGKIWANYTSYIAINKQCVLITF